MKKIFGVTRGPPTLATREKKTVFFFCPPPSTANFFLCCVPIIYGIPWAKLGPSLENKVMGVLYGPSGPHIIQKVGRKKFWSHPGTPNFGYVGKKTVFFSAPPPQQQGFSVMRADNIWYPLGQTGPLLGK